jgi:zinc protease
VNDGAPVMPAPGPPRDAAIPAAVERTLDNGLRVVAFEQRNLPLIAAQLIVGCGGAAEREEEAGLSAMVAALLTQGTTRRSATEIAAAIDALGARLDAGSGYDASVVSVSATTPAFGQSFALLNEIVRAPAFLAREVERVRTKSLSDLSLTYANPSALARLVAYRAAYAGAPYGHPLAGTAATLASLERDRVAWFHERFYRPDDATLVIGGDLTVDEAFAFAEGELGSWRAPDSPRCAVPDAVIPPPRARVVIVDKAESGRTALTVGGVTIPRRSPDYAAGVVANAVLTGYSGRVNQEIRVKRGLSYSASTSLPARRLPALFTASTLIDHGRAVEATEVMLATLRSLVDAPAGDDDLISRKATVTGGFYRGIETIDGIASALAEHVLFDLPLDELPRFPGRIAAVDASAVRRFAARWLVDDLCVTLVGDASRFAADLARTRDVRIIPGDQLDLGSPALEAEVVPVPPLLDADAVS